MFRITYQYADTGRVFYVLTNDLFEWIGTLMDLGAVVTEVI